MESYHTGPCSTDKLFTFTISLRVDEAVLAERRAEQNALGWKPAAPRKRNVTTALKAYAAFATSADRGAVRDLNAYSK